MRTGKISIRGKEYLMCFSTRVLIALGEKTEGNDADTELQRMLTSGKMEDLFTLLQLFIDAGDRYAKLEEIENPGTLTYDELVDSVGVDEYEKMFNSVVETVKNGQTPTVDVEPDSKNAKTTRGK